MISLLISKIFGCAHNRTTFPLTRRKAARMPEAISSCKSKLSEGARSGTYVACLECGKEFDYNWKEMRIGSPVAEPSASRT
jgi:hypothetical protein